MQVVQSSCAPEYVSVVGFYEYGDETSSCIKGEGFFVYREDNCFGHSDDGANNSPATVMRSALCAVSKCS